MLLQFKTKNFKSFYNEMDFSLIPAPKQKDLEYSVLKENINKKQYKALCSAVIYGPNASGKTNIIAAMDVFKNIILTGNINNNKNIHSPNFSNSKLELIPNVSLNKSEPTSFYIKFIDSNILFEYELEMDLGLFYGDSNNRKILNERLTINEKPVFTRKDKIDFYDIDYIDEYMLNGFSNNAESAKDMANNSVNDKELFLMNGFKLMFSSELVSIIKKWFENKFMVIYRCDAIRVNKMVKDSKGGSVYIDDTTNKAAKYFGINSNAIGYAIPEDGGEPELCSLFKDKQLAIPAEVFESYGTVRFINMFPLIMKTINDGSILVLDEFDANIHPMAIMSIINLFHNNDINKNNAQLVFNTHNPIFLNSNLFRRDEIKFVERDDETHFSEEYSLSDFKTSGSLSVRKTDDYMKHYFLGKYGAIMDVDFSELFSENEHED